MESRRHAGGASKWRRVVRMVGAAYTSVNSTIDSGAYCANGNPNEPEPARQVERPQVRRLQDRCRADDPGAGLSTATKPHHRLLAEQEWVGDHHRRGERRHGLQLDETLAEGADAGDSAGHVLQRWCARRQQDRRPGPVRRRRHRSHQGLQEHLDLFHLREHLLGLRRCDGLDGVAVAGFGRRQSNAGGSAWYAQVKATQELAKDTFDAINNQVAFAAP